MYVQVVLINSSMILLSHTDSWFLILAVCMDWIFGIFHTVITFELRRLAAYTAMFFC